MSTEQKFFHGKSWNQLDEAGWRLLRATDQKLWCEFIKASEQERQRETSKPEPVPFCTVDESKKHAQSAALAASRMVLRRIRDRVADPFGKRLGLIETKLSSITAGSSATKSDDALSARVAVLEGRCKEQEQQIAHLSNIANGQKRHLQNLENHCRALEAKIGAIVRPEKS